MLLKLGDRHGALTAFEQILVLGFRDDHELMLQIGRALFREGLLAAAQRFFEFAVNAQPDCAEASACVGYAAHRLNDDSGALYWLRRALQIDPHYSEARIYLANMLYDRGETEAALHHLHQTVPEDHYDELGIWRLIELKKTLYQLPDDDPELRPWFTRLGEVAGEPDSVDLLLAESRGHPARRHSAGSHTARAVRHSAHRTACDAETADRVAGLTRSRLSPAGPSAAPGRRSCSR